MRSRYTAFVLGKADYLRQTWAPETVPDHIHLDPAVRWLGLSVRDVSDGQPGDVSGEVEFVARSKRGGRAYRLHERSRFRFADGRWLYVDGTRP